MTLRTVRPEEVGLASQQLARVDQHLRSRYIDTGKIAGALTLVARRGQVAHFSPLGKMDLERDKPMTEDTIFRIYSMTKPIASIALMMLYEEGHFQLSDPVSKWIPAWADLRVYRAGNWPNFLTDRPQREMTVRDLLTHQSGLTYGFMERTNVDAAYRKRKLGHGEGTLRDLVDALSELPLEFSPGTHWNYSLATDVVGYLVELISEQKLDQFLQERIFRPLGMVDTGFWVPADKLHRFAANYGRGSNKQILLFDDPQGSVYSRPRTFLSGGGGLVSTAADYLRFARMLLNRGELDGARIIGPKTLSLMTMNHLAGGQDLASCAVGGSFSETKYEGIGFGLGFGVTMDPVRAQIVGTAGEYHWGGMASTAFWVDPVEELIVVFMTQLFPSTIYNFRGQLRSLIYPAILDPGRPA